MSGFRFANPAAFHWLWLVPVVWLSGKYLYKKHQVRITGAFGEKLTPFLTASVSTARRRWKLFLEVMTIAFFVMALARPQVSTGEEEIKSQGVELIIAIDVSTSMLAEDVKPSRLDFAKTELSKLLDQLPGDKVGVVAFAGAAALLSPMSTDKSALKMFIDSLDTSSVSTQGTEFRKALLEAKEAFARGGNNDDDPTTSTTRVILIASDGEDNEPGAIETANALGKEGIRIFSLAFGTEKGAPIPVRDSYGNLRGYKKDSSGQTILSQTRGTVLKQLAKSGQGSFYHATFGSGAIDAIVADINKLEKAEFESQVITNYGERYQIFLFFGLLLALIEFSLGERATKGRIWKGRFEVAEN